LPATATLGLQGSFVAFKALVIHAAVYNLYSQMAADFAVHSDRFGDYWEDEIYRQISPHYLADQFRTPALIIHGQLDYRVPVGQAFETPFPCYRFQKRGNVAVDTVPAVWTER
jgi:dipeptidyl aminopeptidase/acylaminoacyl peptidase